ncbi:hypothetical protein [Streptantibioticus silvisoli]|uniref:Peptidase C39-like domain-containing protein n=1 Tax=Streptantibioticus silvisoli TaxID=2705255 RepID=A0ABT6W5Q2_9ACTN|nr:hypothetical protein [Streptantibioticus silvisoli]MDI5965710.1 hypothetical protein [Streptantibioticus silvisoli]
MPSTTTFRGGRLPAQPGRPHLKFSHALGAETPAPPATADWLSEVTSWGMYLNDQLGDCTCAGVAHKRIGDLADAKNPAAAITDDDVLHLYEAVGHYVPGKPNTDQGAVCQDVLEYWQKTGFDGEKIVAFAKVDISNVTEVRQAIAAFGQIYCGFNFPDSAMNQFDNGQPWDVVKGAQIEGGHCVTVGAYDSTGFTCVTWGATQKLTLAFWKKYFDEAWVIITPDFVNTQSGVDNAGLDLYALGEDYAALTGETNPIPAPQPQPTPSPAPAPTPQPAPSGADQQLADAAHAWLAAKGL